MLAGYGDSTYAPIPLMLSNHGYGMLLDGFERAGFDLAASREDRWSWQQNTAEASLTITAGTSLTDLVRQNADATGHPPLPPIWAFGVIKTVTGGQQVALDDARRLRALGVPVSAIYAYDAVDTASDTGWRT